MIFVPGVIYSQSGGEPSTDEEVIKSPKPGAGK